MTPPASMSVRLLSSKNQLTPAFDNRTGQQLPDRWFIRDGKSEVGTGCSVERLDDAERQLAAFIAEKWSKPLGNSDPAQVLIADALALYSMERGPQLKADPATMKGFVGHLNDFWGDSVLSDVKRSTCNAYVRHRTAQAIRTGSTGRKVSAQTARRELEVLSAAIGFWDAEHHLTRRPMVVLPEKAESNRDALTRSQAAALLRATMQKGDSSSGRENRAHLRRFILIGLYTGTRSTAIKRLSWLESLNNPWVDLDRGIIYRRGRNESVASNKKRPLVKLPPRLLAHLRRWHRIDEKKGLAIVIHHGGEQIASVRTGFAACAKAAGLSGVTPHWLRHTAATWLMEQNVDSWEAAGYLGMTTATLESHYGHHRPDHQSAARRAMG